MLFKANIDSNTVKDKEKLAEQLYLFLNDFAYVRLRYEGKDTIEDCIQDTIMYMLDRFKEIENTPLDNVNIEKYFYNRANSFISYWLNNKKKERKKLSNYAESQSYMAIMESLKRPMAYDYIDYSLLKDISSKYVLDNEKTRYLTIRSSKYLAELGFIEDEYVDIDYIDANLDGLSYAVVDEYLVKSIGNESEEL